MGHDRLIQNSIDLIENHLFEKLSIHELATSAFFSRYHYQRLFHAIVGDSVMEYIKKRRLSLAGREICETNATILDIALKYGYSSHESFIRAFKAYHGITPTDCRKFKIFSSFGKRSAEKGLFTMSETIFTISRSTDEILGWLNDLVVRARQAGELAANKAKALGLPTFVIIAKETDLFADEMQATCERITRLTNHSQSDSFDEINQGLEVIKALDNLASQAHIIVFNTNLQIARTIPEYQGQLTDIGQAFTAFDDLVRVKTDRITALFVEITELISVDLRKQVLDQIRQAADMIGCTSGEANSMAELVKDEVQKAGAAGRVNFSVVGEQIQHIADMTKEIHQRMSTNVDALSESDAEDLIERGMGETKQILGSMADCGYQAKILAFTAKLQVARTPECTELIQATNQIFNLADSIPKVVQICGEYLDEAGRLLSLMDNTTHADGKPQLAKILDDIIFQVNILNFYSKTEMAMFHEIIGDQQRAIFAAIISKSLEITSHLHNAKTRLAEMGTAKDAGNSEGLANYVSYEVGSFGRGISEISEDMHNEGIAMAGIGSAVVFLAQEYTRLVDRVNEVAEEIGNCA